MPETLTLIYLDYLLISFNEEKVIYFNLSTKIDNVPHQSTTQHPANLLQESKLSLSLTCDGLLKEH